MKTYANVLILVATVILLFLALGCIELLTTEDKINLTDGVDALMVRVDEFQNVFKEAAAVDLINAEETKKRNEQIDEIQEVVLAANEAIREAPNLIEGAIAANQITAPVNPYAGVIDAVLKIIAGSAIVGGTTAGVRIVKDSRAKKGLVADRDSTKEKLKATNRANEKLRLAHPDIANEHYDLVAKERVAGKGTS